MTALTNDERAEIRETLRIPRGRYSVMTWSYGDLVYAQLCLFLRSKRARQPDVADRVASARAASPDHEGTLPAPGPPPVDVIEEFDAALARLTEFAASLPVDVPDARGGSPSRW